MGKARPAFSPFSLISLREQSSSRSLGGEGEEAVRGGATLHIELMFNNQWWREASPDLDHGHAGFEEAADVLADLSVSLGRLSEVVPHLLVGFVQHPLLLVGRTPRCAATGTDTHTHTQE